MQYLVVSGTTLKQNNPDDDIWTIFEGDAMLQGIGTKPDISPNASKEFTLYCRDSVAIMNINKLALTNICNNLRQLDIDKGITYLQPHYKHMAILDYKFKERLEASGDIGNLFFYLSY